MDLIVIVHPHFESYGVLSYVVSVPTNTLYTEDWTLDWPVGLMVRDPDC